MGGPCDTCVGGNMSTETDPLAKVTMGKILRTMVIMMVVFAVTFAILWVVDR
jgi:hypothetical protein